jgi:hypothetical protein
MLPDSRDARIADLILTAPRLAYGMIIGVQRAPYTIDIPIQFSSSTVNAPPVVQSFQNNVSLDTLIERVTYNIDQPNTFPGSPFRSLYFNQMKQSGSTGIGIQMDVYGAPRYSVNLTYTDLGNLFDVLAITWPNGLPLVKQSNVKLSAILLQTPISVPVNVVVTFTGWQNVDDSLAGISDDDARERLRRLGFTVPDPKVLLRPA